MSSEALTYQLQVLGGLISHANHKVALTRDGEYSARRHVTIESRLEAEVRSGDYFVTLATTLDALSSRLDDYEARVELEGIVSDLIYLQDNYAISKSDRAE